MTDGNPGIVSVSGLVYETNTVPSYCMQRYRAKYSQMKTGRGTTNPPGEFR